MSVTNARFHGRSRKWSAGQMVLSLPAPDMGQWTDTNDSTSSLVSAERANIRPLRCQGPDRHSCGLILGTIRVFVDDGRMTQEMETILFRWSMRLVCIQLWKELLDGYPSQADRKRADLPATTQFIFLATTEKERQGDRIELTYDSTTYFRLMTEKRRLFSEMSPFICLALKISSHTTQRACSYHPQTTTDSN
jgi:hypothetical protein